MALLTVLIIHFMFIWISGLKLTVQFMLNKLSHLILITANGSLWKNYQWIFLMKLKRKLNY